MPLLLLGALNCIEGIAAIGKSHFLFGDARYIISSLDTWGRVALCITVIQLVVGVGVFVVNPFRALGGVLALGLNAIAHLPVMPAYPCWSLCIFALDILAIYGLIAYGKRIAAS